MSEEGENLGDVSPQGAEERPRMAGAKTPPVTEGQELELEVIAKGRKGDGIAKIEGYIIFVPGGNVGDKTWVRITTVRPNFAISEAIEKKQEGQ